MSSGKGGWGGDGGSTGWGNQGMSYGQGSYGQGASSGAAWGSPAPMVSDAPSGLRA